MWFERNGRTYPTRCRDCGADVFYHTNGFGDAVLFDALGWPWPVHVCWQQYVTACRSPSGVEALERREFNLIGFRAGITVTKEQRPQYEEAVRAYDGKQPTQSENNIARVEPKNFLDTKFDDVAGIVQSHIREPRYPALAESGIGRKVWTDVVGERREQMTVVDLDLNSFTFRVSSTTIAGARAGDLVMIALRAVEVPGIGEFFVCDDFVRLSGDA